VILVDTSVWVSHFRAHNQTLARLLESGQTLTHPFVIGEIALGNLRERSVVLHDLALLPCANVASEAEVLHFISRNSLFGIGIGYVDVHLLASVRLRSGNRLWTLDKHLRAAAENLQLAATADHLA